MQTEEHECKKEEKNMFLCIFLLHFSGKLEENSYIQKNIILTNNQTFFSTIEFHIEKRSKLFNISFLSLHSCCSEKTAHFYISMEKFIELGVKWNETAVCEVLVNGDAGIFVNFWGSFFDSRSDNFPLVNIRTFH